MKTVKVNSNSESEFSLKEKIAYSLASALGIGAIIFFGSRLVKARRSANSDKFSFQEGSPQTIAKQIKMAFENDGQWGTDVKRLRLIMSKVKSKDEMEKVRQEYQKQYNSPLYRDMQSELQSSEYDEMMQIIEGKPEKTGQKVLAVSLYRSWAKRFKAAFDKTYSFIPGTDEEAIKTVIQEIPTQSAFIQVGVAYYKEYNTHLLPALKSELEAWEYPTYLMMITTKPK
jgi:uncharacterized protein (UPF0335 family)